MERQVQMKTFGPLQSEILDRADQRFYTSEKQPGERLDVLLALYAVQNRSSFANTLTSGPASQPR